MQDTLSRRAVRRFFRNRMAVLGLIIFTVLVLGTLLCGFFLDYETSALQLDIPNRLSGPGAQHWFGTDDKGRDIFARIFFGGRNTLLIGLLATLLSVLTGGVLGSLAGYFGGWIDGVVMRVMEVVMCLPSMLLAIAIVVTLGSSMGNLILAIGIAYTPRFALIVRSSVMSVRSSEYVQAAQVIGTPTPQIILRHVLRNCMGPIIVQATLIFASAILNISSLSFLGLGIKSPTPEWGNMLSDGKSHMRGHAHFVIAPGMAIFCAIFSLNLLGDGLRDALDPRMDL